jgi:hypothetical protein
MLSICLVLFNQEVCFGSTQLDKNTIRWYVKCSCSGMQLPKGWEPLLYRATAYVQRPLFCSPMGDGCRHA